MEIFVSALVIGGLVAAAGWVVRGQARGKESREVMTRAIQEAEERPLAVPAELRDALLEAYRVDHDDPFMAYGASFEERLRLAGHIWKMGHKRSDPVLMECVQVACRTFQDVRRFVRWYDHHFSSVRPYSRHRLMDYPVFGSGN